MCTNFGTEVLNEKLSTKYYDVLLTMHLSIILVINQLNAQIIAF